MNSKLRLSLLWWLIGALITTAVVFPFATALMDKSVFWVNVAFGIGFIVLSRTLIQLRQTLLADHFYYRLVFFILLFPLIFISVDQVNHFQYIVDYDDLNVWLANGFKAEQLRNMRAYIQSEFMFFGVGTIIGSVLMIIRLVLFTWKTLNTQART